MTDEKTYIGLTDQMSSPEIDKIAAALAKAQGEIPDVAKNGKNTFFNNAPYALYEDIMNAIRPVAKANGLAIVRRIHEATMHTILTHSSGQWIDYGHYSLGEARKHQERGSALTYAKRYVDGGIFGVAPEVDDDANAGNDSIKSVPEKELNAILPEMSAQEEMERAAKPEPEVSGQIKATPTAKPLTPPKIPTPTAQLTLRMPDNSIEYHPNVKSVAMSMSDALYKMDNMVARKDFMEANKGLKMAFTKAKLTLWWDQLVDIENGKRLKPQDDGNE